LAQPFPKVVWRNLGINSRSVLVQPFLKVVWRNLWERLCLRVFTVILIETTFSMTDTPLFHVNILQQYIKALIVNIKPERLPKKINLIFDSGAVNGLLGIGAALYIHHLEKAAYMKINKISGCSIGSLIAVWYICDCPDTMYGEMETLFAYYKINKNFYIFEQIVTKVIFQLFPTEGLEKLNGRLYINYYDTKKSKQRVISHFKSRAHLITTILRSAHIPFLTTNSHKFQGRYVDGIAPYIFPTQSNCKNLFVQLIHFTDICKSLNIKREKNIYSRLIRGVVDANEFFINDMSHSCRYVSYKTKIHLYLRQYFMYFFLAFLDAVIALKNSMPDAVKETVCYHKMCLISQRSWLYLLNSMT